MGKIGKTFAICLVITFLISFGIFPQTVKAQNKTIVVPDDYPTIQAAIDHAVAGDTVYVKAGTYSVSSNVNIDKPISLIGENKQNTTIYQTSIPYHGNYDFGEVGISADNVILSGFTLNGGGWGIRVSSSGCKIMDNNLIYNYLKGIDAGGSKNVISGNNITRSTGFGIYLTSSDTVISQNQITKNSAGIIIDSCKNVTVNQNYIAENNEGGLNLRWTGPFHVEANNITGNLGCGIQFGEICSDATVVRNNIIANRVGVSLFNYAFNPSNDFLPIVPGLRNQVFFNNLVNNTENAHIEHASSFIPEDYAGNGTDVVSWDNGVVGNYWSDYCGKGNYRIDQKNTDHHPLALQVDIYSTSTIPTPNPLNTTSLLPIAVTVSLAVVGISGLLFYHKRKANPFNQLTSTKNYVGNSHDNYALIS